MGELALMELTVILAYVQEDSQDLIAKLNFLNATRSRAKTVELAKILH